MLGIGTGFHAFDTAAAGADIAHDVAHVILGDVDVDAHDWFEQDRVSLAAGILEAHRAGDLKRHFG